VRRPEPAVVPEGEVAVYLVAGAEHDYVAGAARGYIFQLLRAQLVILFGTDGMSGALADPHHQASSLEGFVPNQPFVSSPRQIDLAMNETVWSAAAGTGREFDAFIDGLESARKQAHRVIVFGPEDRVDWLEAISATARQHAIQLTVALVPARLKDHFSLDAMFAAPTPLAQVLAGSIQKFNRSREFQPRDLLSRFQTLAGETRGELIICETSE
ncbi:MAG: hypothetical protein KDD44_00170, partial [Bdellovibrionales bacterium]|nr:hypothetical protein [Bdellovibrionales bacterium]